ncbi:MAG: FAD-binding oxidoreductase [Gracilimonas sp.]|uniref:NAD(P)/FAD-dependent oxidoreductase n=1 Tax=Gracilimonas sp. TaxID=1974203 RepID=UPI0019AC10F0|nr:FAD-dependent oxidoreductase [Gracilimonas sp.]MBD3615046.1 FAD-binding oxidoreductase [Gracilimonas sp.]
MNKYYAAVFGAGISGTAIANELAKRDKKILLIDPHVSENAPGAPAGLVNPATGRRAKKSWRCQECMEALRELVDELIRFSGRDDLISDTGTIRPAINEKLADNFKEALDKYNWPEGWIRWINEEEVSELNPEIAPNFGALFLDCGFTVYVDRYLNTYRKYLREKGVKCRYEKAEYQAGESGDGFRIKFENGEVLNAEHVIVAAGHQTPGFRDWEYLPLHRVKGQIVWFEADEDLDWNHATSAMGYSLRRGDRDLIVGSTYEHKFEDLDTTEKAFNQIKGKLVKMFPNIAEKVRKKDQMAGVRVTTPNRLPVIGRHPQNKNLCIYTAMGSKGLLFSQYVGSLLAEHLINNVQIPEEIDTVRFE